MNERERVYFRKLPANVTVYRAYPSGVHRGCSWWLDKHDAWLCDHSTEPHRFRENTRLATGRVNKRDVVACIFRSTGTEIIVDYNMVEIQSRETLDYPRLIETSGNARREREEMLHNYLWCCDRSKRLERFQEIADELTDTEYWSELGSVWVDAEGLWNQQDELKQLLEADRRHRHYIMSKAERAVFEDLPETLTIYRGFAYENRDGWSWTLDPTRAIWFALRFPVSRDAFPQLATGTVSKQDAIAYFGQREEMEILVNPQHVKVHSTDALRRLNEVSKSKFEHLAAMVLLGNARWIHRNTEATIGELAANLRKAHLQCERIALENDCELVNCEDIPEPLNGYIGHPDEDATETFGIIEERLSQDIWDARQLLRVVGPDCIALDLVEKIPPPDRRPFVVMFGLENANLS